jgi:hypothetical protein
VVPFYNTGGTPISGLNERRSPELFLEEQKDLNVFMEALTARVALEAMTPPKIVEVTIVGNPRVS